MTQDMQTIELAKHEAIIERNKTAFIETGNALAAIRDGRLYQAEYKTFEEYCQARWGWNANNASTYITPIADLLTYRCYRANAMWFASLRQDAYSVTVRDGLTFSFAKGEMMGWAQYWLDRSLEYWHKLQLADAPGVAVYRCGSNAGSTTDAQNANSPLATDTARTQGCICPDCTRQAMNLGLDKSGGNVIE